MVEDTCMESVDFGTIILDIKMNRFYCDLPSSIKMLSNKKLEDRHNQSSNKKRKIVLNPSFSKVITNDSNEREWKLKTDKNWNVWRHKVGGAPILSCNSRPCYKFHARGSCFSNYSNKLSHRKLTGSDFKITDEFIRMTRRETE